MTKPLFTIIIPTYNRPGQLYECLKAIYNQRCNPDKFEVIVVDDGSDVTLESTDTEFRQYRTFRLINQTNSGPAAARNIGADHATGKYLVFTDDDCRPAEDWLSRLEQCFQQFPESAVTGHTINSLQDNIYSTSSQLLISYLYTYYNYNPLEGRFLTSNNLAVPADTFHMLGGFNSAFPNAAGEDRELCDRWVYHGFQLIYEPLAIIYHSHHLTLRAFWHQHFTYGRAAFHYHRIVAERRGRRIRTEPLSFYFQLLLYPVRHVSGFRRWLVLLLLVVAQIANAMGFVHEYRNRNGRQ